jgi:hypothetical protein
MQWHAICTLYTDSNRYVMQWHTVWLLATYVSGHLFSKEVILPWNATISAIAING